MSKRTEKQIKFELKNAYKNLLVSEAGLRYHKSNLDTPKKRQKYGHLLDEAILRVNQDKLKMDNLKQELEDLIKETPSDISLRQKNTFKIKRIKKNSSFKKY